MKVSKSATLAEVAAELSTLLDAAASDNGLDIELASGEIVNLMGGEGGFFLGTVERLHQMNTVDEVASFLVTGE